MAAQSSDDSVIVDHPLTEKEVEERAKSDTPYFKLSLQIEAERDRRSAGEPQTLYIGTDNDDLHFPAKQVEDNLSVIMTLKKYEEHSYAISNRLIQGTYLKVTEEVSKSKRIVKFVKSEQYESQLFKLRKDPRSETKFALYTSAPDSNGHNKFYCLTPSMPNHSKFLGFFTPDKSAAIIMAEESISPDGYCYFSMSKATLPGSPSQQSTTMSQSSSQPTEEAEPLQEDGSNYDYDLLFNLKSFKRRAQSEEPLFLLRKSVTSTSSTKGYLYSNKDSSSLCFFHLTGNHTPKDPSDEALLKMVYHEEDSTDTKETFYFTIESTIIPDHYLAINLEQPSQEGSDTYYPVQFISTTEVKWYRGNDTGTSFSLYTYIKAGSLSTKFYLSLKSELSTTVCVTCNADKTLILEAPELGGILTTTEFKNATSTTEYKEFVVSVLSGRTAQNAYLDTVSRTLSYREPPPNVDDDLSVIMLFKRVDSKDNPPKSSYIWSSKVTPNRYLTVTSSQIRGSTNLKVAFETGSDPPTWSVTEEKLKPTFFSFQQVKKYLVPENTINGAQLVGSAKPKYKFKIRSVTN